MNNFDKLRKQIAETIINSSKPTLEVDKDGNLISRSEPGVDIVAKEDTEEVVKIIFDNFLNFLIDEMKRNNGRAGFILAITGENDETGEQEIIKLAGGNPHTMDYLFKNLFS